MTIYDNDLKKAVSILRDAGLPCDISHGYPGMNSMPYIMGGGSVEYVSKLRISVYQEPFQINPENGHFLVRFGFRINDEVVCFSLSDSIQTVLRHYNKIS